jgi:hypothetical protein
VAWLRELGLAFDEIPLLDERIISRIIDPPRDEKGRLKVRPKGDRPLSALAAFRQKWRRQGMEPHHIERLWRDGLRA